MDGEGALRAGTRTLGPLTALQAVRAWERLVIVEGVSLDRLSAYVVIAGRTVYLSSTSNEYGPHGLILECGGAASFEGLDECWRPVRREGIAVEFAQVFVQISEDGALA